ncbi:hypothetical protein Tco_0532617 [Tanacetum coccineum]
MDDSLYCIKKQFDEPENNIASANQRLKLIWQSARGKVICRNIGPVNDEEPFAEVQLTALHNILANEQHHTEQSEPNYDTHLLETIVMIPRLDRFFT